MERKREGGWREEGCGCEGKEWREKGREGGERVV